MAYENIEITEDNFCVGPVAGTFCYVDTSGEEAVMRVKNSSGGLLDTYPFYPAATLSVETDFESLPYSKISALKYTGPVNQIGFYSGMMFFTMERKMYAGYYVESPEGFILRKWVLNKDEHRLDLETTYIRDSDAINYLDCYSFAVHTIRTTLADHALIEDGQITLPTTSGIAVGDAVVLGPSSDTSNEFIMEHCTVFSIDSDTVISIRTRAGSKPPLYEYISGNPVTIVKDIYTISSASSSYPEAAAALYKLDAQNYYNIIDKHESHIYDGVIAMDWNATYGTPTFVKDTELLSAELSDYEISKSHVLKNITNTKAIQDIYEIAILDTTIYRLQAKVQKWSDEGLSSVVNWATYNYVADTMLPYVASIQVTSIEESAIITRLAQIDIKVKVRDQFGVSVRDKNIQIIATGDTGSVLTPANGQLLTDANGEATILYDAGATYNGNVELSARSNGSSTHLGSQYVWVDLDLISVVSFSGQTTFEQKEITPTNISIIQYYFSLWWLGTIQVKEYPTLITQVPEFDSEHTFEQAMLPYLNEILFGNVKPSEIVISQRINYLNDSWLANLPWLESTSIPKNTTTTFSQTAVGADTGTIDQTYISRHYSDAHTSTTVLDQFIFINEARPPFWSEKNSIATDIWLRLRPFATDLDPNTLIIKIREVSYAGDTGWVDITSEGAITLFDAGSGLNGLEFLWYDVPPFHHNSIVYVTLEVKDTAAPPNKILTDYWFRVIPDFKAPYIDNLFPSREEFGVPVDTAITFDIHDLGSGIDIDTLEILLNYTRVYPTTITRVTGQHYQIGYTPPIDFYYSDTISVEITVSDVSASANTLHDSWRFYTMESAEPWIDEDNFYPGRCVKGLPRKHGEVIFQVYGVGDGVDEDSIEIYIDGPQRDIIITPIVYRLN